MVEDNKTKSKRVAKNTLYLSFRMLVVMAVGLYTSRVILQTLGVDDYGIYNVVGGVVVLFSFLKQAMTNATYRYLAYAIGENKGIKSLKETFSMSMNAHLIIAGIVFLLSETAGLWFLNTQLVFPAGRLLAANVAYQFSILSFYIEIIKTPYNSAIIAHEHMSFFATTSIWEVLLKLLVVYLLVILPWDNLINYSWLLALVALVLFVWYRVYCRKHFTECKYIKCWNPIMLKDMLKYSGWSILVNGTDVAVTQSIVFFFNVFYGVATNAALAIANTVSSYTWQFLQNFSQALSPQIIKSYAEGDMNFFYKLIYSTSKLSYYLFLLVAVPLALNIDFILKIWLGIVPDGTGTFVLYLLLFSLFEAFNEPLLTSVHATGKLKTHQIMISIIKVSNIPLAYICIKLGYEAWTAIAIKAGLNLVSCTVRPIYMRKLIQLPLLIYVRKVVAPILATTILVLPIPIIISMSLSDGWIKLFTTSSVFVILFGLFVCFVGIDKVERNMVIEGIKSKIKL